MSETCPICERSPCDYIKPTGWEVVGRVSCSRCGTYDITEQLMINNCRASLNENERLRLSHAIRKATDAHGQFSEAVLGFETAKDLAARLPLPDAVEQADIFIESIARRCSWGDTTPPESIQTWAARLGVA